MKRSPTFTLIPLGGGHTVKTWDDAQLSHLSCPRGHNRVDYRSRVPSEDLQVYCCHCGAKYLAQQELQVS